MDNFYSNMYGSNGAPKKPETTPTTAPTPVAKAPIPAHQRLSGLKITSSHMFEVEINGRNVTIPSAAYIKLLEDQIKEFRANSRQQANQITRLTNAVNKLNSELDKVRQLIPRRR